MPSDAANTPRSTRRPTWRFRILRLLLIAALTYITTCIVLALLQSKLIYFPTKPYTQTPADVGLAYEELTLTAADGVRIAAWYVPRPDANAVILYCHGNAGNISDRVHSVRTLYRLGYGVLIFDYRGYGRSDGKPSEEGTYKDAVAAWDYLADAQKLPPHRIVVFGRSLGGAVAVELAARRKPAALVVESTFTSLYDIGRLHYPLLPVGWMLTYRYDSILKVPHIGCPKLFIHGRDDTLIPLENGKLLYEAASPPKTFLETPGGHNTGGFEYAPEYSARAKRFIDTAIGSN